MHAAHRIGRTWAAAFAALWCWLALGFAEAQAAPAWRCNGALVTHDAMIPSDTQDIFLFVRNKRPTCDGRARPDRVLLYVHGATYPSETAFDLPIDGESWMDHIARQGWDVWLVDLRGYGQSTRPPEMDRPAADHAPIVTTSVAVRDVHAAVDHIRATTGQDKLVLLGWSWGTTTMGAYAARHPERVEKLVLYAPVWVRTTPSPLSGSGPIGAYRVVERAAAKTRWLAGVPADKVDTLIPSGVFERWIDATWATDPTTAKTGKLRAPNGVVADLREYWLSDRPFWNPALVTAPTLIAVAEWDQDTPPSMSQAVFARLTASPQKRLVLLGEGTHSILLEKNRHDLWNTVQQFIDE
jgi:pimeloyl-ACP methyl ester carboxylesterase